MLTVGEGFKVVDKNVVTSWQNLLL